jgi:hypothetical protein
MRHAYRSSRRKTSVPTVRPSTMIDTIDTTSSTTIYPNATYQSITSLAGYKVPYNEYLVEISGSLTCSRDYLYWFKLAVLGNI